MRFDHGEDVISLLSEMALKENISLAAFQILGAIERSHLVCGPKEPVLPPDPNLVNFNDGREAVGFGTITSINGKPRVHLHASFGQKDHSLTGCMREGSRVFITLEVVIWEISGISLTRKTDEASGIDLVCFDPRPGQEAAKDDN